MQSPEIEEQDTQQQDAGENSVQEFETKDGQPYAPDFSNLSEERVSQLRTLIQKFEARDQWARMVELLRCTLRRFFWIGLQHVWWNADVGIYQVGPSGSGMIAGEDLNAEQTAMGDYNIFTAYGKSFIATFAQASAGLRFEPDQPKDSRSIKAAEEAEKYKLVYQKFNPTKEHQIDIGKLLWTDGRVLAVTDFVPDARSKRAGEDDDKAVSGKEMTRYFGVLETKVPIFETEIEDWTYCKVSEDHDITWARGNYENFADQIEASSKQSNPNDEMARMARIATSEGVEQLSQDTLAHIITEDKWWLRPAAFTELEKDSKEFFQNLFPDGCRVVFCGSTYCGAKLQSMQDAVGVMHAMPGKGQARPSLSDPEVPIQMLFNDAVNMTDEMLRQCIPSTWVDIDKDSMEAIAEQLSRYGEYRPFKRNSAEPMEQFFFQEQQVQMPEFFAAWLENLQGPLSQFVTGQMPSVFGGNLEDQKTARGYQLARDQALGLMTLVWVPFKKFSATVNEQAAKMAAKRTAPFSAIVEKQGKKGKTDVLDIDPSVLNGGFTCSPITDENFPESWSQKSNKYIQLLTGAQQNPMLAELLQEPDNVRLGLDLYGLSDLTSSKADSSEKQLAEITEMVSGSGPVPDEEKMAQAQQAAETIAPGASQMLPRILKSSVPIDFECDDHGTEAAECLRFINSPEGQTLKIQNPEAYQDIRLHFLAHEQAKAQKAMAMASSMPQQPPKPPMPGAAGKSAPKAPQTPPATPAAANPIPGVQ